MSVEAVSHVTSEAILVQDPLIKSAVMFGRGKFYAGLLVDPAPSEHYDLTYEQDPIEYRNRIWYGSRITRMER